MFTHFAFVFSLIDIELLTLCLHVDVEEPYYRFRMAGLASSTLFSFQPFDLTLFHSASLSTLLAPPALSVCSEMWVGSCENSVKPSVWTGTELKSRVLSVFSLASSLGDPGATQNQPLPSSEASQVKKPAHTHKATRRDVPVHVQVVSCNYIFTVEPTHTAKHTRASWKPHVWQLYSVCERSPINPYSLPAKMLSFWWLILSLLSALSSEMSWLNVHVVNVFINPTIIHRYLRQKAQCSSWFCTLNPCGLCMIKAIFLGVGIV